MKLFDPEGPLMSALGTLADLMFCNILFCLCALPLFTAGASLTALYGCTLSLVEGTDEPFLPAQFLRLFRRNFPQSTALWFLGLAAALLLRAYAWAVGLLSGTLAAVYRVTFFVLVFLFLAGFQYVFPLLARYGRGAGNPRTAPTGAAPADGGALSDSGAPSREPKPLRVRDVLAGAWLLSAAALPATLGMLAVSGLAVYLSFFLNPAAFNSAIFLWAFLLFAAVAYLHSFLLLRAFRKWEQLRGTRIP